MPILTFIIVVVVIGVIMWLVNAYIPMEANIKKFLNIAIIVILVIWLLYMLFGGSIGNINQIRIGGH